MVKRGKEGKRGREAEMEKESKKKTKTTKTKSLRSRQMESWWPELCVIPFHVPPLARVAVPTQTAALGRSDSPTPPLFLAPHTPH